MADWSTPVLTTTYTALLDGHKNRDLDLAYQFSPTYSTATNIPVGTIRWNPTNGYWEIRGASTWSALVSKYLIDVDLLDGQHGAYYLAWSNFTGVPATFPPSAHTHDDRYYTETEGDARYGNNLFVSGNTIALRNPGNTALSTITVPYATNAGTVAGFSVNQNLNTNSAVSFTSLGVGAGLVGAPSILASGDTNTGIYFPGADIMSLVTGGVDRIYIDASGNVGMGATPTAKLDVAGAIRVISADDAVGGLIGSGASSFAFTVDTNKTIHHFGLAWKQLSTVAEGAVAHLSGRGGVALYTVGVERMRVDAAGNVGIGKVAGSYRLDVNGAVNLSSLAIGGVALTPTAAQLNFVTGVTSSIQTQLNSLQTQINATVPSTNPTFTGTLTSGLIRLPSTGDVALASTGHALQVGADSSVNLAIDNNELQARNNGAASTLTLNFSGGNVTLGSATSTVGVAGTLTVGSVGSFVETSFDAITYASSITPDLSGSNFKTIVSTGALTINAPPAGYYTMVIRIQNGTGAGAITLSGFTKVTGDTFTTTVGDYFLVVITRSGVKSLATVVSI